MNLDLLDLILLCVLAVGATALFCVLSRMLDGSNSQSAEEIEAALKRAEDEINNRPRVRAINKTN